MIRRHFSPFLQAHGAEAGPDMHPVLTGVISSAAAMSVLQTLWHFLGIYSDFSFLSRISVEVLYVLLVGWGYGLLFRRAANDPRGGWIFGAATGFACWMLNPLIWLPFFGKQPLFVGSSAVALMASHLLQGGLLGLLFPHVHRALSLFSSSRRGE